ncbi:MAG: phosphoglycolate phosphatase [Rubellimicrobium sp.]|nr:phosphoglycolate phosphatase [Rubellimicrobium sp.]
MRRAVVLDLDGTLIDSAPDIRAVANRVLAGESAAPLTLEETRSFIGNGTGVFVARMMAARGLPEADHARLHGAFLGAYDGAQGLTRLYPGAMLALGALAEAGFALGICTNKPASATRAVLAHFGLAGFFGTVIGGDSLTVSKPDPAPLIRALSDLGADRALFVGDSEVDHQTAQAARVPFALFTGGYRKAPVEAFDGARPFDHHAALPGLVAALMDEEG